MMRKTLYICDGCGEEHRDGPQRLILTTNRRDACLNLIVGGNQIVLIPEGEDRFFCDIDCLMAYLEGRMKAVEERSS